MLRATVDRVAALGNTSDPIIVTNSDHADAITREMVTSGYRNATLILEPVGRNTAPAVAVAAMEAMKDGDPLMLILPADHTIADETAFRAAVGHGKEAANAGYLVTFGITPSRPETGYGYIKVGAAITPSVDRVVEFREKPDEQTARSYIDSSEYLWNSGMFLIRASTYLNELEQHAPDIAASCESAFKEAEITDGMILLESEAFSACRADSIDYAVMEQTSMAAVVPTDPGWNDVGSWSSLFDIADKDEDRNVLIGDVVAVDTTGTYARSSDRLVATVGIEDMIVVDTPDAVLVARMDSAQDVKVIVDKLKDSARPELASDGTALKPWGRVRTVDTGPGFRVLHLRLDPRSMTSLKSHRHRTEHWIVVRGVARITTGETTRLVPPNEAVTIPPDELHRLENPGDDILEVIEVDIGTYVGEDDVAGYLDTYGRTEERE